MCVGVCWMMDECLSPHINLCVSAHVHASIHAIQTEPIAVLLGSLRSSLPVPPTKQDGKNAKAQKRRERIQVGPSGRACCCGVAAVGKRVMWCLRVPPHACKSDAS